MATSVVLPLGPASLNITGVRAGDRNLITLTLTNAGVPMDLTGLKVEAQARKTPTTASAITAVIVVVNPPASGVVQLRWPGDEVRTMLAGKNTWSGVWDLQVGAVGEDPVTIVAGTLGAEMDVTRGTA